MGMSSPHAADEAPLLPVEARSKSWEGRPRRATSPGLELPVPQRAPGIRINHPLSRSMVDPRSAEAAALRSRFSEAQSMAIMQGLELPSSVCAASTPSPPPPPHMVVVWLCASALLSGTAAQLCNELIFRADPDSGDTVSLVEYAYCALASSGALRHSRRLPWSCHVQLFATGLLYSKLMNAGLAVRE